MEKCNICGRPDAENFTWSEEWICNSCAEWIDEGKLRNVFDDRKKEKEFADFWMTFCNRENLDFNCYYAGLEIAKKDLDYYFNNDLWKLVDRIKSA